MTKIYSLLIYKIKLKQKKKRELLLDYLGKWRRLIIINLHYLNRDEWSKSLNLYL
jgi:hypothetical protein